MLDQPYDEAADVVWEDKANRLYWTRSTTGGHGSGDYWRRFQRHQLVGEVNGLDESRVNLCAGFHQNPDLYNVKLGDVTQGDEEACVKQREYFTSIEGGRDTIDAAYGNRFLFDMDSNSYSGRFISLLRSRSLVLKQTMQQEFFDEWLFPWVHYVPVSMVCRYKSLCELLC